MMILKEGDTGSLVQTMQLALKRSGHSPGATDGIFGSKTKAATIGFQQSNNLVPDGIIGRLTFEKLRKFLTGYTTYVIKPGDTINKIAAEFNSTEALIENANPSIEYDNLKIGSHIFAPFNLSLVDTTVTYNSLLTELICEGLAVRFPFVSLSVEGYSIMKNPLPMLKMGRGPKKVFVNASHHANEWITTPAALKYVEDFAVTVVEATKIDGIFSEYTFDKTTLYVMPLVNPDGVNLVTGALTPGDKFYNTALNFAENYPEIPFPSGWKANIKGVDLNLNYPAKWETAKEIKYSLGFTKPGPRDFVGEYPLSEPESKTVYDSTKKYDFDITISLHTQGEEIYWKFEGYETPAAKQLGERMAWASGYSLKDTPYNSGFAGYKDWFIMTYKRPGYTVEAGLGRNPLPLSQFESIYHAVSEIISEALRPAINEPRST